MAHFKTAYGQKEVVLDVTVASDLYVGDMVKLASGGISKVTDKTTATHIVAQSDMTLNRRDYNVSEYEYSNKVAKTTGTATKKVALFKVIDVDDVIE